MRLAFSLIAFFCASVCADQAIATGRLAGRDLGSAMKGVQGRFLQEVRTPPGTEIQYGGLYQVQRDSFLSLAQVLLMSILLIFITLVFEFRSFSHPIAILIAMLLCGFGALLALLTTGSTLNETVGAWTVIHFFTKTAT